MSIMKKKRSDGMPKISIIIPVYNVEKYLEKCLESVLAQTFSDYEVLLIDDGSTDSSAGLCDVYKARDKRIRVIHQCNQGLSSARNVGIRHSRGAWVTFLDSDDWWEPDYLQKMELEDEDLCICGYRVVYQDSLASIERPLSNDIMDIEDYIIKIEEYYGTVLNFAWGKMYKKELLLETSLFPNGISMVEDIMLNIEYYKKCKKIRIVEGCLLNYRQVNGSLSHSYRDDLFECYEKAYSMYIYLLKEFDKYLLEQEIALMQRYWGNYIECAVGVARASLDKNEKKQILQSHSMGTLYQRCLALYTEGRLTINNRMNRAGMKLLKNRHSYLWIMLITVYDWLKGRRRSV